MFLNGICVTSIICLMKGITKCVSQRMNNKVFAEAETKRFPFAIFYIIAIWNLAISLV